MLQSHHHISLMKFGLRLVDMTDKDVNVNVKITLIKCLIYYLDFGYVSGVLVSSICQSQLDNESIDLSTN
jgi:hypothetical protein